MGDAGSAHGRYQRAISRGNVQEAEAAAREMGGLSLGDALEFVLLLARADPSRYERAALRFHARLEVERRGFGLEESQLVLACLACLVGSRNEGIAALLRRTVNS